MTTMRVFTILLYGFAMFAHGRGYDGAIYWACALGFIAGCYAMAGDD